MSYVDGFVIAVPTANREAYKALCEKCAPIFNKYGALNMVECWGDDVPEGKVTSFRMAVKQKQDESVVFAWITWPSRQVRDEGMKQVMSDTEDLFGDQKRPFDGKRMIFGGFEVMVEA